MVGGWSEDGLRVPGGDGGWLNDGRRMVEDDRSRNVRNGQRRFLTNG